MTIHKFRGFKIGQCRSSFVNVQQRSSFHCSPRTKPPLRLTTFSMTRAKQVLAFHVQWMFFVHVLLESLPLQNWTGGIPEKEVCYPAFGYIEPFVVLYHQYLVRFFSGAPKLTAGLNCRFRFDKLNMIDIVAILQLHRVDAVLIE